MLNNPPLILIDEAAGCWGQHTTGNDVFDIESFPTEMASYPFKLHAEESEAFFDKRFVSGRNNSPDQVLVQMYMKHRMRAYQAFFHINPDYAYW